MTSLLATFPPPPNGTAEPTYCVTCGLHSAACACGRTNGDDQRRVRPRLPVHRASELIGAPRPNEIVEGIAAANSLTVFAADSGIGKTFASLDIACAVSDGTAWHGRAVRQGSVVYVSFEGDALGLRLQALRDVAGRRLEHLYVIRAHDAISPRVTREGEERAIGEVTLLDTIDALQAEIAAAKRPPITLAIIDTVRQSMAGSEDSSEHTSAYLRSVRRIMAAMPGAAMILVHHTGWQDGDNQRKRERGSSAWRGNCDATLYLEAGEYDAEHGTCPLVLRTLKVRDAERPAPLRLIRRRVELPETLNGDLRRGPVTSCIIEPDRRTREDDEAEQERALEAIDIRVLRAIGDHPEMATSQATIRGALGLQRDAVCAALGRLGQRRWIVPPARQRQPYSLTPAGQAALENWLRL